MNEAYYHGQVLSAAEAPAIQRATFVRRTYTAVALAFLGLAGLDAAMISAGWGEMMLGMLAGSKMGWLLLLGVFMFIGWFAQRTAISGASRMAQYAGLALYVAIEAVIFLPLLTLASLYHPEAIMQAGIMTLAVVGGLTAVVFGTRTDFSFLRPVLTIGMFCMLGLIVCSMLFSFSLGTIFVAVMIGLAAAAVLYSTSNILHRYGPDQDAAAALDLFASVALLFYYILMFFMGRGNNN